MREAVDQAVSYLYGIWRYRWYALAVAWTVSVAGWLIIYNMPNRYESSALIQVDTESVISPLLRGLAIQTDVNQRVQLMTRTLLSRPNLEKVLLKTGLDIEAHSADKMERALRRLRESIHITTDARQNNLYTISYSHDDPERAKRVVDALLTIFVESTLGKTRQDSKVAQNFLDQQIKEYEARLSTAEERVKEFKRKNIGLMPSDGKDYFSELQAVQRELAQVRLQWQEATNRRDELKRQLEGEVPTFGFDRQARNEQGGQSLLDARIQAMQQKLDELLLTFTDRHPDVLEIKRTIESLKQQKGKQAPVARGRPDEFTLDKNPVYQQIKIALGQAEADIASLSARVKDYESKVADLQGKVDVIPQIEAELQRLNRDYDINKENYRSLVVRRESARISEDAVQAGDNVQLKVMEPPRVPILPSGPKRMLLTSVSLLAAIATGIGYAFLMSKIRPVIFDRRTLYQLTGTPVFGVISFVGTPQMVRMKRLQIGAFVASSAMLVLAYGVAVFLTGIGEKAVSGGL